MAFTVHSPRERVRIYTDADVTAGTFTDSITTSGAKAVFVSTNRSDTDLYIPLWRTDEERYATQSEFVTTTGNNFCRKLTISALGTNPTGTVMGVISGDLVPERLAVYNGHASNDAIIQIIVVF